MPELPDVTVYCERLDALAVGHVLEAIRLGSPFVLRTFDPPWRDAQGRTLQQVRRFGKRIALGLDGDLWLVIHLMIAGRLRWQEKGAKLVRGRGLVAFDFDHGTLVFTEASKKQRASLHVVRGGELPQFDRGGRSVFDLDLSGFCEVLDRENHTVKRALTDPRLFDGVGNSYSDEILHRARLSPVKWTTRLTSDERQRLYDACRDVLMEWTERTRTEVGDGFPDKVTAFRDGMAVHGRFGQPCPDCGMPVQRIAYADNETNYCAVCQTDGNVLKDRALSQLLKGDWPRTLAELEERLGR